MICREVRGACDNFINHKICRFSLSKVLIGIDVHAYIRKGEYACVYMNICICTMFQ